MSRRMMTREVTKTTALVSKIEVENGVPVAVALPEETFIGNVKLDKAQKQIQKKYDFSIIVTKVETETKVFEMAIEDFIKVATERVNEEEEPNEQS